MASFTLRDSVGFLPKSCGGESSKDWKKIILQGRNLIINVSYNNYRMVKRPTRRRRYVGWWSRRRATELEQLQDAEQDDLDRDTAISNIPPSIYIYELFPCLRKQF